MSAELTEDWRNEKLTPRQAKNRRETLYTARAAIGYRCRFGGDGHIYIIPNAREPTLEEIDVRPGRPVRSFGLRRSSLPIPPLWRMFSRCISRQFQSRFSVPF